LLASVVGTTLRQHPEAALRAAVAIDEASASAWRAKIELGNGLEISPSRTLEGSTCAEVVEASVVVIGTFVLRERGRAAPQEHAQELPVPAVPDPPKPRSSGSTSVPARSTNLEPASTPREWVNDAPPPQASSRVMIPSTASPTPGVTLFVQVGPTLGLGPGLGAAIGGGIGIVLGRRARVELSGMHRFASETPPFEGISVRTSLSMATATGCWTPQWRRVTFLLCGGAGAGAAVAVGRGGLAESARSVRPWIAGLVQPGVHWNPHPRIGLRALIAAFAGLQPSYYAVTDAGERVVYAYPPLGGWLVIGGDFTLR